MLLYTHKNEKKRI